MTINIKLSAPFDNNEEHWVHVNIKKASQNGNDWKQHGKVI